MLDINLFRADKGGDPEVVRESQRRRFADVAVVDQIIELDQEWKAATSHMETLKMQRNALNKQIGEKRKKKEDATELQEQSTALKKQTEEAEVAKNDLESKREKAMLGIGNLVHDSVPVHNDEANNVIVKKSANPPREEGGLMSHVDLVQMLDIVDLDAGTTVAGGRGFYLRNEGVLLNQALIQYALHSSYERGSTPIMTPFFMRQDIMGECAQLAQFDEELYKVTGWARVTLRGHILGSACRPHVVLEKPAEWTEHVGEGDDKYLIATSEQPLCAMHRHKWFEEKELPLKYVGYSTCFRKEAGSHGRDTLGIFRIHQFEKVEQFFVTSCNNNASWEAFEEMLSNAEDFYTSLGLHYQVVNIVSGELNNAAAKKYDLEAWFPHSRAYRELVSCSNCLDYQSRRLEVRLRTPKPPTGEAKKDYVHMLNCTLSATERTLCCILENYQTAEGVRVPEALQPFMPGRLSFIPFRKQLDPKTKKLVPITK